MESLPDLGSKLNLNEVELYAVDNKSLWIKSSNTRGSHTAIGVGRGIDMKDRVGTLRPLAIATMLLMPD
jgi:hypothetical protein